MSWIIGEVEKIFGGGGKKKKDDDDGGGFPNPFKDMGLDFDLDLSHLLEFPDLFNLGLPKPVTGFFKEFGSLAKTGEDLLEASVDLLEETLDIAPKLLHTVGIVLKKLPHLIDVFVRIIEWLFDRLDWLIDEDNAMKVLGGAAAIFLGWFMKQNSLFSRNVKLDLI